MLDAEYNDRLDAVARGIEEIKRARPGWQVGDTQTSPDGRYVWMCVIETPDHLGQTVWTLTRRDRGGERTYVVVDWVKP